MSERAERHISERRAEIEKVAVPRAFWSAIFSGTFVMLASFLTLCLLGLAIGVRLAPAASAGGTLDRLGIGAGTWWIVAGLIALFCGGIVAGWMSGIPRALDGALHGLVVWGLSMAAILVFLTTTMGTIVGGSFEVVRSNLNANQAVASVSPTIPGNQNFPAAAIITADLPNDPNSSSADTGPASTQYASSTVRTVTTGATLAFIMLILGAGAAALGGSIGAPSRVGGWHYRLRTSRPAHGEREVTEREEKTTHSETR